MTQSTGWQRSGRRLLALTEEGHVSPRMRTGRAGFKPRIAGGLLAALLSVGELLSSLAIATPASADTDFCGRKISDINPGTNGIAALQELTAQGENQVIHNISSAALASVRNGVVRHNSPWMWAPISSVRAAQR